MTMDCRSVEALWVPGGGIKNDGTLTEDSLARVRVAAEHQVWGNRLVIFSGGTSWLGSFEEGQLPEADLMREEAERLGIPEERILADGRSRNTIENVLNCAQEGFFDGISSLGTITQGRHQRRCRKLFRHLVPNLRTAPIEAEQRDPHSRFSIASSWAMYRLVLAGVEPGDLDTARDRNDAVIDILGSDAGKSQKIKDLTTFMLQTRHQLEQAA